MRLEGVPDLERPCSAPSLRLRQLRLRHRARHRGPPHLIASPTTPCLLSGPKQSALRSLAHVPGVVFTGSSATIHFRARIARLGAYSAAKKRRPKFTRCHRLSGKAPMWSHPPPKMSSMLALILGDHADNCGLAGKLRNSGKRSNSWRRRWKPLLSLPMTSEKMNMFQLALRHPQSLVH